MKLFTCALSETPVEELLDVIFDADEIWHGSKAFKNMFFNMKNEMLVEWDLAGNP